MNRELKELASKLKHISYALIITDDNIKLKPEYYFDWKEFKEDGYYYYYIVGVRGAGKTFSGFKWMTEEKEAGNYSLLVRRTEGELELMLSEMNNPLKPLIDEGVIESAYFKKERKKTFNIYMGPVGLEEFAIQGVSLNTFGRIRSADFSMFDNIFWDEFIKQPDQAEMKKEGEAWLNMIETVCRNRYKINVVACANSNDIYNPVFKSLGLVAKLERLYNDGKPGHKIYKDPKRHIKVIMYEPTYEFKEFKKHTALHDLTEGTDYAAMAYENKFIANDFSDCCYHSIVGYSPKFAIDNYCIWSKKGSNELYISYAMPEKIYTYYSKFELDVENVKMKYYTYLRNRYLKHLITFESYDIKRRFLDILQLL